MTLFFLRGMGVGFATGVLTDPFSLRWWVASLGLMGAFTATDAIRERRRVST